MPWDHAPFSLVRKINKEVLLLAELLHHLFHGEGLVLRDSHAEDLLVTEDYKSKVQKKNLPKKLTFALARNKVTDEVHRDIVVARDAGVTVNGQEVEPFSLRLHLGSSCLGGDSLSCGHIAVTVHLLFGRCVFDFLIAHLEINN